MHAISTYLVIDVIEDRTQMLYDKFHSYQTLDQLADIYRFMLRNWVFLVFVINGILMSCFRYTPTLDGPLHMARAHLLLQHWSGAAKGIQGFIYDVDRLGHLRPLDLVAVVLLKFTTPEFTHQIIIALLVLLLGVACVALTRSYGARTSPALLLALPLTFNVLILFGFFNFTLVIAISFMALSWWNRQHSLSSRTWLFLLFWTTALWWIHRGGPFLFAALIAGHEFQKWRAGFRNPKEKFVVGVGVVVAAVASTIFLISPRMEATTERNALMDLLSLRPLLMVDQHAEMMFLLAWGLLFLAGIFFALKERYLSKVAVPADGLWITAALLMVASMVFRTHGAYLFYFVERAQFVAILLLCIWVAVTIRSRRIMISIALLSFGIHIGRQVFLEERMSVQGMEHTEIMQAAERLSKGTIVLTINANGNWLLQHEGAWLMIEHNGAVLTNKDQYWFAHGSPVLDQLIRMIDEQFYDLHWLQHHLANGQPPLHWQIFLIGPKDKFPDVDAQLLQDILEQSFTEDYSNPQASIYSLRKTTDRNN